jgi:outer membrane protein assembly factor BamB
LITTLFPQWFNMAKKIVLVALVCAFHVFITSSALSQLNVLTEAWNVPLTDAGKAPQARPLMAGGAIFLVASSLEAFAVSDGHLLWKQAVHHTIPNGLVESGGLICTADERAYCVQKESGKVAWSTDLIGDGSLATPASGGTMLFVGTDRHTVFAFSTSSGRQLWRTDIDPAASFRSIVTGEAVSGEFVYVASTRYLDRDGAKTAGVVNCLDAKKGVVMWSLVLPTEVARSGATDQPIILGKRMFLVDRLSNRLLCISLSTHRVLWMFRGKEGFVGIADVPVIDARRVYIGSGDRHIYALDIATGAAVWDREIGGSVNSVVSCGSYLIASDGEISALRKGSGQVIYADAEMHTDARISSKLFSENGNLAFASRNSLSYYTCRADHPEEIREH